MSEPYYERATFNPPPTKNVSLIFLLDYIVRQLYSPWIFKKQQVDYIFMNTNKDNYLEIA